MPCCLGRFFEIKMITLLAILLTYAITLSEIPIRLHDSHNRWQRDSKLGRKIKELTGALWVVVIIWGIFSI